MYLIALAHIGDLHAGKEKSSAVLTDRHQPRDGRQQLDLLQPRTFTRHFKIAFVLAFLHHGEFGQSLLLARLDVAFQLQQAALGFFEVQLVLLLIDRRQQLIALDFEFRAAHGVAGAEQFHLILTASDGQIRFGFGHLLIDLVELELLVFNPREHFGVVELDDQVLLFRKSSQRGHSCDLHSSKQVRSVQRRRADRS